MFNLVEYVPAMAVIHEIQVNYLYIYCYFNNLGWRFDGELYFINKFERLWNIKLCYYDILLF